MKVRTGLFALGGALLLAGIAWAMADLTVISNPENVVSHRISGMWTLDADWTRRLDANGVDTSLRTMKFTEDANVLTQLRAVSDRFSNRDIFGAGKLSINGEEKFVYIVTHQNGNPQIVWIDTTLPIPYGDPVNKNLWIAVGRDRTNDVMLLGGDVSREASAAFCRIVR